MVVNLVSALLPVKVGAFFLYVREKKVKNKNELLLYYYYYAFLKPYRKKKQYSQKCNIYIIL